MAFFDCLPRGGRNVMTYFLVETFRFEDENYLRVHLYEIWLKVFSRIFKNTECFTVLLIHQES